MKSSLIKSIVEDNSDIIINKIFKKKKDDFAIAESNIGTLFIYNSKYKFKELNETNIPISTYNSIPDGKYTFIIIFENSPYFLDVGSIITKERINKKLKIPVYPISLSDLIPITKTNQSNTQSKFVHLHCHSDFSLVDGISTCEDYLKKAKELGMDAIAITDHGNVSAHLYLQLEAKKLEMKSILGSEMYIVKDASLKDGDHRSNNHIVIIAKNEIGYKNLLALQKLSWSTENFYYRPRIDYKMLKMHRKGLVVLTACLKGLVAREVLNNKPRDAYKLVKRLKKWFGDDLYLEIQLHNIFNNNGEDIQKYYNEELIKISKKFNVELVLTNDVHYAEKKMYKVQSMVIKMKTDSDLADTYCKSIWLKSYNELLQTRNRYCKYISKKIFKKAAENTIIIADKCNYEIPTGGLKIPTIDISRFPGYKPQMTEEDYIRYRVKDGIRQRSKEIDLEFPPEYIDRIEIEIDAFVKMEVISYILIYDDLIRYLKKQGCLCSLRGSANGSVVLWLMGLSIVDPVKFNILFERFISPARIEARMADIDIDLDISHKYRDVAINYLKEKYGEDKICIVGTFGRTQLKSSVKNMARVEAEKIKLKLKSAKTKKEINKLEKRLEQFSYQEINKITKLMPDNIEEIKDSPVAKWFEDNKKWFEDYVVPILGNAYSESLHPAGVVISPVPYHEWIPIRTNKLSKEKGGDRVFSTQWENSHTSVEHLNEIGAMIMDILGVKTITIVDETLKLINKRHKIKMKLDTIPLDNKKTYETLSEGENLGTFQLNKKFIKPILRQTKPDNIEDLIFLVSADRPGPMASNAFEHYYKRKHGEEKIETHHPSLKKVYKDSFGVLVYSEHLMRTATVFAGMNAIDSEKMRKIVKSKNPADFLAFKEKFISGAIKKWTK